MTPQRPLDVAAHPKCVGGLRSSSTCGKLATVICSKESVIVGAPPLQWYSCDDPKHQEGGAVRRITKKWGSP